MTPHHPELDLAVQHALAWVDGLPERKVPASARIDDVKAALPASIPEHGLPPEQVIDGLARAVEPGLMAVGSPRFYGWVMGGALPASLAADWLVSAWDQNGGMREATPGVAAVEETAAAWLLDVLALLPESAVGFTTDATTANFSGLAAARGRVLRDAGWDVEKDGLTGAPRVRVLAGAERHTSVDLALRYLGLGGPELIPADSEGRIDAAALATALTGSDAPTIVVLQAGNLHSGAFDPFRAAITAAHDAGAWVHVDGAFGLWALAVPRLAALVDGLALADSWATDAHKTLNVPYDGGIVVVRDVAAIRSALGVQASYLWQGTAPDPFEFVPEMSRRARGIPVYAALASLGRDGVRGLVEGLVDAAQALAAGLAQLPGATILNDVVYTQVCVALEDDDRTKAVLAKLLDEGDVRPSGSVWRGRSVIRFSVSNYQTDAAAVERTLAAVRRAL